MQYVLLGLGALVVILAAGSASYLAEVRDEAETSGTPIERVFSWARYAVTLGIALWIGIVGMVGAYIVIDIGLIQ